MDEKTEILMVKVTDNTATAAEREALMDWLQDKPELARNLAQHQALKALTDGWVERLEVDLQADRHAQAPSTRWIHRAGFTFLLLGILSIYGQILWDSLMTPAVPTLVRLGLIGTLLGALILLASLIFSQLRNRKTDRYKEVIR